MDPRTATTITATKTLFTLPDADMDDDDPEEDDEDVDEALPNPNVSFNPSQNTPIALAGWAFCFSSALDPDAWPLHLSRER